jgi:anti-sigma factor RsiW
LLFFAASTPSVSGYAEPLAKEARTTLTTAAVRIESSDRITVRQWLATHIGFPVEFPDISGAVLVGARLVDWRGAPSAAIVYDYHGLPLTYFALPRQGSAGRWVGEGIVALSTDGYGVALWTEQGNPRAVAAPMDSREVRAIAEECRRKATSPS